ncbi:MAG: aminotransferase class I/II-fold pyridoxal phosphate-dependent enzyme [bacterium]|nr:aminotransferase class I/II-fold pyridoxal phosphate-dependent enzyme [bacterium]
MSEAICALDGTVDLRSDTVTKPSLAMREAMAEAEVGDDVMGEDPTVNRLQQRVSEMAGMEAALFVPSGTMANLLAVLAQTRPGDTVALHRDSHPFNYESGNLAMVAGVLTRTADGPCGVMSPEDVAPHIIPGDDHHFSPTTLVCLENTTNRGGGAVYSVSETQKIAGLVHDHGLRLHCDGARIFNACVATGATLTDYAGHVDTLSFCFSKGLGAPVGSVLVGDVDTIDRAHRFRKMLGGGMRQAGILAAAALYALEHNVCKLADDHRRAAAFRAALEDVCTFPFPSPTNIVFVDVDDAQACMERLAEQGVLVGATGPNRIRAVFHLDVDDAGLDRAIEAFRRYTSR